MVAEHTGLQIDLGVENATAMRIENLREFDQAYAMLSKSMMLAANG